MCVYVCVGVLCVCGRVCTWVWVYVCTWMCMCTCTRTHTFMHAYALARPVSQKQKHFFKVILKVAPSSVLLLFLTWQSGKRSESHPSLEQASRARHTSGHLWHTARSGGPSLEWPCLCHCSGWRKNRNDRLPWHRWPSARLLSVMSGKRCLSSSSGILFAFVAVDLTPGE